VLTIDVHVYAWGQNDFGQIGNGTKADKEYESIPYHVKGFNEEDFTSFLRSKFT